MKKIHLILFLFLTNILWGQKTPLDLPANPPTKTTEMPIEIGCAYPVPLALAPEFYSGKEGLAQFIKNRLEYPKKAKRKKTTGTVVASFMIEKDGVISEIKILQSLPNGCDEAVINLIKRMPKWRPAREKGRPIRFLYELPVEFELEKK